MAVHVRARVQGLEKVCLVLSRGDGVPLCAEK